MVPGRRAELLLRERVALFLARPAPDLPLDRFAGLLAELLAVRLLELLERPAVEPDAFVVRPFLLPDFARPADGFADCAIGALLVWTVGRLAILLPEASTSNRSADRACWLDAR
jgi:hypothetical protein